MTDYPRLADEFGLTTVNGTPYGVIDIDQLFSDLGGRLLGWVIAGHDGITEEKADEVTAFLWWAFGLIGSGDEKAPGPGDLAGLSAGGLAEMISELRPHDG